MAWTLEQAKLYLGVTDPAQDANVQLTMDTVIDTVNWKLGREILRNEYTELRPCSAFGYVILENFPVEEIREIIADSMILDYDLNQKTGLLKAAELAGLDKISVRYVGGYDGADPPGANSFVLPLVLERVLYEILGVLWARTDADTGGPVPGTIAGGTGEVKKVVVFDAFSVEKDVGSSGVVDAGAAGDEAAWGWLAPWAPVLNLFRSGAYSSTGGLGIA